MQPTSRDRDRGFEDPIAQVCWGWKAYRISPGQDRYPIIAGNGYAGNKRIEPKCLLIDNFSGVA